MATPRFRIDSGTRFIAVTFSCYTKALCDFDGITPVSPSETIDTNIIIGVKTTVSFKYDIVTISDKLVKNTLNMHVLYCINKDKGLDFESFFDDNDDLTELM